MKRYRKIGLGGGLFSATEHEQAVAAKTTGILKLCEVIPWESLHPLLEDLTGYVTRDWKKGGKPSFEPVLMFKVLVLQMFHGLNDDATEEQIFDRTSFKNLLGLHTGDQATLEKELRTWCPQAQCLPLRNRLAVHHRGCSHQAQAPLPLAITDMSH